MKHIKDAQNLMQKGDGAGALAIANSILELAPNNPEALRIKAHILGAWGFFNDSLEILLKLSRKPNVSNEIRAEIDSCIEEERESAVFSKLTPEGRWYFAFPKSQMWISLAGFIGCGLFLLLSPEWIRQGPEGVMSLFIAFALLVLLPWTALMVTHFIGIKKILIGIEGLCVHSALSHQIFKWEQISVAVIEYDVNPSGEYLKLHLYTKASHETPLIIIDVSKKASTVRARRHFVRTLLTHIDSVVYKSRAAPLNPMLIPLLIAQRKVTELKRTLRSQNDHPDDRAA